METIVLRNGSIVTPAGVKEEDLLIKGTRIHSIGGSFLGDEIVDCKDCYVLPGFRDQHIHDVKGFKQHLDNPDRLPKVSKSLASQGVTAYMISTFAAPTGNLVTYIKTVRDYMSSGRNGLDGARVEGVNVEGTFIREECAGAQPCEYIVPPNKPEAMDVLKSLLATGVVKLLNIVPDFGTKLIEYAASKGVIVGCGHSLATAEQLARGFRHGLKFIVHLMNGSIGRSFKPFGGGGTFEGALTLPLFVELITDGYHVDWRYISDIIWRRIQQGRPHEVIVVTDGIFPIQEEIPKAEFRIHSTLCAKSPDGGVFVVKGRLNKEGSLLRVPKNTLCSSKLTMNRAFENLVNLLTKDLSGFMIDRKALSLSEAIRYSSMLTSSNQALMQGVLDNAGSIEPRKLADLTILRIQGQPGECKVEVEKTVVAGTVFSFS